MDANDDHKVTFKEFKAAMKAQRAKELAAIDRDAGM